MSFSDEALNKIYDELARDAYMSIWNEAQEEYEQRLRASLFRLCAKDLLEGGVTDYANPDGTFNESMIFCVNEKVNEKITSSRTINRGVSPMTELRRYGHTKGTTKIGDFTQSKLERWSK